MVLLVAVAGVMVLPTYRARVLSSFDVLQSEESSGEVDGSTLSRITENLAAISMFSDHVVFGVGPDGYPSQYERYAELVGSNVKDEARRPHNLYLGIAAELGLVGLVTFLIAVGLVLVRLDLTWRRIRDDDPESAAVVAAFFVAVSAYLVSGIFLHLAFERYLWALLALGDAAARIIGKPAVTAADADEVAPTW